MPNLYYIGLIMFDYSQANENLKIKGIKLGKNSIVDKKLYITQKNLIKYEDKDYLLIVDGQVYRFKNQLFTVKLYFDLANSINYDAQKALESLDGEFTIILYARKQNKIYITNSESGSIALYYYVSNNRFIFSNSIAYLNKTLPQKQNVNFEKVFDFLVSQNLGTEETFYSNIHRLLPGNLVIIDSHDYRIIDYTKLYSRRSFLEINQQEIYERFRELLRDSIEKRVKSQNIGSLLSSGKDSTAVTAMAAKYHDEHKQIYAYSFKPTMHPKDDYLNIRNDETILLQSFIDKYPKIKSRLIIVEKPSIIISFERSLNLYNEPIYGASNLFWIDKALDMIKEDNAKVLLSGQGGNFTISWPPPEMIYYRRGLKHYLKGKIDQLSHRTTTLPYISKDLNVKNNRSDYLIRKSKIHELQPTLIRNSINYVSSIHKQASLANNIDYTDPTVDKSIIEFCLSLPFESYHDKNCSRKLISIGMKDMIPDEILQNKIRGIQSSDIKYRINNEKHELHELILSMDQNKLVKFVIDTESLIKDWQYINFLKMKRKEINHILRIIQVGMFLNKQNN